MISGEFQIPVYAGRLSEAQRKIHGWALAMLLGAVADKVTRQWTVTMDTETLAWLGVRRWQASVWMHELETTLWVVEVKRTGRGTTGKLGLMYGVSSGSMAPAVRIHADVFGCKLSRAAVAAVETGVGVTQQALAVWQTVCEQARADEVNAHNVGQLIAGFKKQFTARVFTVELEEGW